MVTDLGAGPELARVAVGGLLNPADACVVLSDGSRIGDLTAERVVIACRARRVEPVRAVNRHGDARSVAAELATLLLARWSGA